MPDITEPPQAEAEERPLIVRLAWFVGIAAASAGAVIALSYVLRALLR